MSRRALLRLWLTIAAVATTVLAGAPGAHAAYGIVGVTDNGFMPSKIDVHTGDTVAFVRARDAQLPHSVTSDTGAFPEQTPTSSPPYSGLTFNTAGTYPYYCRYHGGPGGAGMSGVVVVSDPAPTTTSSTTATTQPPPSSTSSTSSTTSTTRPPTTTTTRPPTTTTTRPPTTTSTTPTTTAPPTTATSGPTVNGRPMGPAPAPTPTTEPPRAPAPSPGPKKPAESSTTSTSRAKVSAAAIGVDTTSTTGAIIMPPAPDLTITTPPESPTTTAPAPPAVQPVQLKDMEAVARGQIDKPVDNGAGLLLIVGAALAVIGVISAVWAWYHRASRYLPA